MIKDKLENSENYYSLSKNIRKGLEWLSSNDLINIENGKHIINGDSLYANVQEYETKSDADYEAHKKYIDIQYIINGNEYIGVSNYDNCKTCKQYDPQKDIEFLTLDEDDKYIELEEGEFMILFPNDAHKPSINPQKQTHVKKAVVKVAVD